MGQKLYWGDLHNHNAMGYAKGSLERSIEIAQSNLDFFAFTGHAQWHDMVEFENDVHMHWVNGFKKHSDNWGKIQELIAQANIPGKFASFLGYEWHSSSFGDYCLIYPYDNGELRFFNGIKDLQDYAKSAGAMLIPHHIGYKQGHRGFNRSVFDESNSPVVEIYSEHGCCEIDGGPYDMISHSMGGRTTENTLQSILSTGKKFGVVASTDDHLGYPGGYGEGLVGVYSESLDRKSIWDAIWNRRTYAVTGDRIELEFYINDEVMGSAIDFDSDREIAVKVNGWDEIHMVEIIKNNEVIHRHFPDSSAVNKDNNKIKTRIEYGWGPWSDLSIPRICDWEIALNMVNAKITEHCTCFQSGPYASNRRNSITKLDSNKCEWISYTSRKDAFLQKPLNAVAFEIEYEQNGKVILETKKPSKLISEFDIVSLKNESLVEFTGDFPKESIKVHKAVPEHLYKVDFKFVDKGNCDRVDYYYVRVTQNNGQMAWSSPIWVG